MQCPLCRERVELVAKTCVCGFNLQDNDPADVITRARQDLKTGRRLLWLGLAGAITTVLLVIIFMCFAWWMDWVDYRDGAQVRGGPKALVALVVIVPFMVSLAPMYGLGRGIRLFRRGRRHLAEARQRQALPTARVV